MGNKPDIRKQGKEIVKQINTIFESTTVGIGELEIELLKIMGECMHCLEALQYSKKAEQIQLEMGRLRKKDAK